MIKNLKFIALLFSLIPFFNAALGQDMWESFGTTSSPWTVSSNLKCICQSSQGNTLIIMNMNYPSEDDERNNTWTSEIVYINPSDYNSELSLDVAFTVRNLSHPLSTVQLKTKNGSSKYYTEPHRYWNVVIEYTTTSDNDKKFKINYSTSKYSSSTTRQSSSIVDNGKASDWKVISTKEYRRFRILFDEEQIEIYDWNGDNLLKTIYGVKKIKYIKVGAGPGTELEITNTICQRKTIYGQSLSYLNKAANHLDNNNASSAASEMTSAINKGLKSYDTYLMRGIAYYVQGYYKSAIEDFTSAISFSANNKELAYYYRGMSKLALEDDYGINDLKNAGQNGLVFLRENNLMNYTPGQSKKKSKPQKKLSPSSQPKKPALKK